MNRADASVMIMAGGTGGHIFPGLAVAEVLLQAGVNVHWLGASGGMECDKVPAHGIAIDTVPIRGLRGKGLAGWLAAPFRLWRAVQAALRVFAQHQPHCAISFGGYVAGPGGIAARLRGIPLVVHEQNAIPGLTNRVLARFASSLLQAFPDTFAARSGAQTCGNPVRAAVSALAPAAQRWQQRAGPMRLLVTGGSQGAQALNRALPEAVAMLPAGARPLVRHQSGTRALDETRSAYARHGIAADVSAFIDDMATAYGWADIVVCRSGALTVSELAAAGLGAILVPFPHAVDDHQSANARFLVERGAAALLPESELTPQALAELLVPLLSDRAASLRMAQAAREAAMPGAARQVADACLQWVPA
jgi:UDP-N-acetylglucosamine--N-acetylmuramyl-(pentapeptide) pyrophosphoryl-undecaprenol N-acetylglucosamine transferase